MTDVSDALALDARPRVDSSPLEQTGTIAVIAVAGALQFSIAIAQILLTIAVVCYLGLLAVRRVRFEAPPFFWPLLAYAAMTLVSALF